MSAEARSYLATALDSIQGAVLVPKEFSWSMLRDSAFTLAAGAVSPFDTYPAIAWALRRANRHSFLQVPTPGAVSRLLDDRIAYIHVPQRGGPAVGLADSLHSAVGEMQAAACGWIVDIRANGGGNMWPMLAGIGPLLGDTLVGSFGGVDSPERWYYKAGVSGILTASGTLDTVTRITIPAVESLDRAVPIAVLIDAGTGSSGEAVAIAFIGRPNTRTFGSRTAGFATVNRGLRLSDGANMVVTTGYNADRRGRVYGEQLVPDSIVEVPAGWPSPTDRVSTAARAWLLQQGTCASRH
jgi:C-terminal processing protease CtpA/Prc